ncbi:MAG TPA: hypothetical protein VH183_06085 [Burkholderiaceae bacterium]|nr:hypothetical protein [Burkholderiaceae bacterium]
MADAVTRAFLLMAVGLSAAASAAGVADPTQPPPGYGVSALAGADSIPTPEPIQLQMIARDGSARLAVVNGQRVRPGETIRLDGKNVKVVAIHDDAVVLDRDGHPQMVEMMPHVRVK